MLVDNLEVENPVRKKLYGEKYVVMQNKMIDAYHNFGLAEKRVLILASPIVRLSENVNQDTDVKIKASDYAKECGIDLKTAYKGLESASRKLMARQVYYINEKNKKVNAQWIIRSTYDEGEVIINFTKEAIILMQFFDRDNPYTYFLKDIALGLKKVHAVKIYELLKKNEKLKTWEISVEDIIERLSLPESYKNMPSNIMVKVITPSLEQINDKTDIFVICEPIKKRKTIGYKFLISRNIENKNNWIKNPEKDESELDESELENKKDDSNIIEHGFIKLSDAQIVKYSNELSRLPSIQETKEPMLKKLFESNLTYNEVAQKLADILRHTVNQKYLWEYLNELDFKYKGKPITVKKDTPTAPSEPVTPQDVPTAPSEPVTPQDAKEIAINKLRNKDTFSYRASKLRSSLKNNDLWMKLYPDASNYIVAMAKFIENVKTDEDIENIIKNLESYGEKIDL